MIIETSTGTKTINLLSFSALEGMDIIDQFAAFASSTDKDHRSKYVKRVLSYSRVCINGQELPLTTSAMIDNHLCSPENVKAVFYGVLEFNGIFPEELAARSDYVTAIGGEIASSFVSSCMGALEQFVYAMTERGNV